MINNIAVKRGNIINEIKIEKNEIEPKDTYEK